MLPRHIQSVILRNAARSSVRSAQRNVFPAPFRIAAGTQFQAVSPFHSSSRRQSELPKSPFQTFVDVLRDELKKSRELQDSVKQLQGDVDKLQDSEAMKKAREAYERARVSFCSMLEVAMLTARAAGLQYQGEPQASCCR